MGSLFKAPKAPEPMNVAAVGQQQQQQNTQNAGQQAAFNRVNQRDQFGNSLDYAQTGTDAQGNPVFQASQKLGETGQRMAGGFGGLADQYFTNAGNRPDLGSDSAFQTAMGFYDQNMAPREERQRAASESRLRNQGFDPSAAGFKDQMGDLALQQNEARNSFANTAQNTFFNQGLQNRQQQMGELNPGLGFGMGTTQVQQANIPGVNVANVDYVGLNRAAYDQQNQQYGQQMQQRNAMIGGLAGLAGTAAGAAFGMPGVGGALGGMIGGQGRR